MHKLGTLHERGSSGREERTMDIGGYVEKMLRVDLSNGKTGGEAFDQAFAQKTIITTRSSAPKWFRIRYSRMAIRSRFFPCPWEDKKPHTHGGAAHV